MCRITSAEKLVNVSNGLSRIENVGNKNTNNRELLHYPLKTEIRKSCKYCSDVLNIKKTTTGQCAECKVSLCAFGCFKEWHDIRFL
ncbi:hypothetical protein AYI69_g1823 [Smittium culicis]|uniref:PiggyBac transposable element-derived protein 4 C-terminal zinc-ribbon domain-containing protein n=1 Tax=Smittium culicis TaxID=133412 RepID=A0A1R1YPM0_9FUNG|nr:hypothetical protein AYI69_g1823 [Smittium culicis]